MSVKGELDELRERRQAGIRELGLSAVDMYGRREIDIDALEQRAGALAEIDQRIRDLEARLRLATS